MKIDFSVRIFSFLDRKKMVETTATSLITGTSLTDANFTIYDIEMTSTVNVSSTSMDVGDDTGIHLYADEHVFNTILLAVTVTMTAFGCVGNALVIGAVLTHRKLRNLGNAFVVNLAVADLAVSAFINAFGIAGVVTTGAFFDNRHVLCQVIGVICIMR